MNIAIRIIKCQKLFRLNNPDLNQINKLNFSCLSYFLSNRLKPVSVWSKSHSSFVIKRRIMDLASVIEIFEEKVPPHLSESWDNTGLLIEPSCKTSVRTLYFLKKAILIFYYGNYLFFSF